MRHLIREEVVSIRPIDEKESMTKADILSWIDAGEPLCRIAKPAVPPQHLVSYFVVMDGDYILLVDHINAGLWLPTGGHVEPGEHPRETVLREAKEELGIDGGFLCERPLFLTSTTTVGKTSGHTDVSLWYVLKGDRTEAMLWDATEFNEVRWFHRCEIPMGRTDPEMGRFLRKLYPL